MAAAKAAPKKTTAKKAPAKKATTARTAAPRRTAKTIRNLRGTVVHARLLSVTPKDPFRIALNPRGTSGDITVVPVSLIDDTTFLSGVGVLWEVITATEAKELQGSYASVGYLGRTDAAVIIRPEDNTISTAKDWDGKGNRGPAANEREFVQKPRGSESVEREFGTGMHTIDVPGSDQALHAQLKAGTDALPNDVDISSRRVVIERVKGQ